MMNTSIPAPNESAKICETSLDPEVLSQLLSWEDEFAASWRKSFTTLRLTNDALAEHYKEKEKCRLQLKLPSFRGLRITLQTQERPKGRMSVMVPRLLKTPDMDQLHFLPHCESLREYMDMEQKFPAMQPLYSSVHIKSYVRTNHKHVIAEGPFNDFLLGRFVQTFGTNPSKLRSLAKILNKEVIDVETYLARLGKRLALIKRKNELRSGSRIGEIGTFNKKLFCNICYVYCCNLHSSLKEDDPNDTFEKTSLDLENREWPVMEITGPTGKRMRLSEVVKNRRLGFHNERTEAKKFQCSRSVEAKHTRSLCVHSNAHPSSIPELTQHQLLQLLELLKLRVHNPCFLAYLLGDSSKCTSINNYLKNNSYLLTGQSAEPVSLDVETVRSLHSGTYFYHFAPGSRPYTPCCHPGICSVEENCPCAKERGFCEKFCACKGFCMRQFNGCECKNGTVCNSKGCKCNANNRECDPDLCACCFKVPLSTLSKYYDDPHSQNKCLNMQMTLGKMKKMVLGKSSVCEGFGMFSAEDICKNEYICEYLGELISRDEGERRAVLNDISGCTYLFGLTEETFIDAQVIGSKMRYVNHGSHGMENAFAKILYVNGIPKIGLYALRNIERGEEVLFNYRIKKKLGWVEGYKSRFKLNDKSSPIVIDDDQQQQVSDH